MERVGFLVLGLVVGLVAGFVLGFVFYQPQIDKLQMETSTFKHQISVLQGQISSLNSQLNEANRRIRELGEAIGLWEDSKAIQIHSVSFDDGYLTHIYVQNVGVGAVKLVKVYVENNPVKVESGLGYLLEGKLSDITLKYYCGFKDTVKVRVVCEDGTFSEGKFPVSTTVKAGHAIQIQAVSFTLHTATISVQNVGVSTVTINHIFIDGTPRISEPLTAVLTEGATAIFKVTIPNYFTHGREVTIRIVCTDGTFTEGKFIV